MSAQSPPTPAWPSAFFELAGVVMVALDPGGFVLHINPAGARILGRPADEIVGRRWIETFIPARLRAKVGAVFDGVVAGTAEAPETYENPVICSDGSERIIAWRNAMLRDATTGDVVAVISSGEDVTELRQAEAERSQSEARFQATFEQAAVGMAHVGFDGRFLRINDTLCAITGYDREELETLTFGDITHPDDLETDLAHASALRAGDIPHYRLEKRYVRKDGSVIWISLTGSLVRDATGEPQNFLAVVEDIGAGKAAEALRENEELQRLALVAAEAGAWHWDAGTDASIWSPECFGLFGLPLSAAPPPYREFLERFVHPDDRHLFERVLERVATLGDGTFTIDFRAVIPGVGLRWMNDTGCVVFDEARRPIRAFGLFADITRRHQLEEALRESEERLRLAMSAADIGAWDWDLVSGDVNWSRTFLRKLGAAAAQNPTLEEILDHIHPDDRACVQSALESALAGEAEYAVDFRILAKGGEVTWIRSRGAIERDASGRPLRMIGVDTDVTADKRKEEELRRLALELDHRTRNAFSIVQAIVTQTLSPGPERTTLLGRLSALLRAHAMAARGGATDLGAVAREVLAPYPPDRISVGGPAVLLSSRATTSFAMALHELATNAAKYGALGSGTGRLDVGWTIERDATEGPLLRFEWSERVGTALPQPTRKGFGTLVIHDTMASIGCRTETEYRPDGLVVRVTAPLPQLAGSGIGPDAGTPAARRD